MQKSKKWAVTAGIMALSMLFSACAPQTIVQTQVVVQTQEVPVTQQVQVVQTQVVKETQVVQVAKPSFSTPHPILGDVKIRQAIAYCTNRPQLIKVSYPYLSDADQAKLMMDTNIPSISWAAYDGPEVQKYPFDKAKGGALLDAAGWKLEKGATYRTNANGDQLSLHFTTTSAAFRQTWGAVFVSNMKDCGILIVPLYAPSSWWFGSSTGLRRRDFELGAYAWVGESDPKGQTLYACNQINTAENGWSGQNYMGWCNQKASDAINAANNTFVKADRQKYYKDFQIEFAKDMVSLPLFQRAEANAATSHLKNYKPSPTEYYTWNAYQWELDNGKTQLVLGQSQEPASMYTNIESSASQRYPGQLVGDLAESQVDYDYQPVQHTPLSTVESGLAKVNAVDVKAGDPVVDSSGTPADDQGNVLTLKKDMKVKTADGKEIAYDGTSTIKMNQLVVTYKWVAGMKWSDGQPVVKADFQLGYKNDCDPNSGRVDYSTCQSIAKVDFTSDTEYTVTYKPGYANSLYFLAPISYYPSHQVLATDPYKGKTLNDVPAADWAKLKEIAETPLGTGPYILKSWDKGVKMTLEANPNYWRGPVKIKNITILFIQDTNQAVSQLLTGAVDALDSSTLGAGAEVQSVLDAVKAKKPIQVVVNASPTWEHIDMNLFVP